MKTESSFTCANATAALDRLLSPEEEILWREHVSNCPDCLAHVESSVVNFPRTELARQLNSDDLDAELDAKNDFSTSDFVVEYLEAASNPKFLGSIGNYDVESVLGRGGMGIVLKAFDRELKRYVAIKVLSPHLASQPLARKRFAREAQAAAAVVHLNVIPIYHVQPSGRLPFLVMPLVGGESVADRLHRVGSFELQEALRVGIQTVAGLSAAHDQGLVHRDVKPSNILLEKGVERAVLTDFGLARAVDDISLTRTNAITGTPEFMSPEAARGEPVDARSDLFSFGCVLYAMVSGVSPFRSDSTMASLRLVSECNPQPLASLNPQLPEWFVRLVERLLEKDPSHRFAAATEVQELLEQGLAHLQKPSETAVPSIVKLKDDSPAPRPIARPKSVSRFGAIVLILVALAVGGWAWMQAIASKNAIPDIAGIWEGEGWGKVTLRQTSPGNFVGEYTDVYQSAASPATYQAKPHSGNPSSGITLSGNAESKAPQGSIHLLWSQDTRRFHGTWSQGTLRFGDITVRSDGDELRGAYTANDKSLIFNAEKDRVSDLHWKRQQNPTNNQSPASSLTVNDAWKHWWNGSQSSETQDAANQNTGFHQVHHFKYANVDDARSQLETLRDLFMRNRFTVTKVPNANGLIVVGKTSTEPRQEELGGAEIPSNKLYLPQLGWDSLADFGPIVETTAYLQREPSAEKQRAALKSLRSKLLEKMQVHVDLQGRARSWDRIHAKSSDSSRQSSLAPAIQSMIDAASNDEFARAKLELFVAEENIRIAATNFAEASPINVLFKARYELCLVAIPTVILGDETAKRQLRELLDANHAAIESERNKINRGDIDGGTKPESRIIDERRLKANFEASEAKDVRSSVPDGPDDLVILRQYVGSASSMKKQLDGFLKLFDIQGPAIVIVPPKNDTSESKQLSVKKSQRAEIAKFASELLDSEYDIGRPPIGEAGRVQTALVSIDRWQSQLRLIKKLEEAIAQQVAPSANEPTLNGSDNSLDLSKPSATEHNNNPVPLQFISAEDAIKRVNRVCGLLGIDHVNAIPMGSESVHIDSREPNPGKVTDWLLLTDSLASTQATAEQLPEINARRWIVLHHLHEQVALKMEKTVIDMEFARSMRPNGVVSTGKPLNEVEAQMQQIQSDARAQYQKFLSEMRADLAKQLSDTNNTDSKAGTNDLEHMPVQFSKALDVQTTIMDIQKMFGLTPEMPPCDQPTNSITVQSNARGMFHKTIASLADLQQPDSEIENDERIKRWHERVRFLVYLESFMSKDLTSDAAPVPGGASPADGPESGQLQRRSTDAAATGMQSLLAFVGGYVSNSRFEDPSQELTADRIAQENTSVQAALAELTELIRANLSPQGELQTANESLAIHISDTRDALARIDMLLQELNAVGTSKISLQIQTIPSGLLQEHSKYLNETLSADSTKELFGILMEKGVLNPDLNAPFVVTPGVRSSCNNGTAITLCARELPDHVLEIRVEFPEKANDQGSATKAIVRRVNHRASMLVKLPDSEDYLLIALPSDFKVNQSGQDTTATALLKSDPPINSGQLNSRNLSSDSVLQQCTELLQSLSRSREEVLRLRLRTESDPKKPDSDILLQSANQRWKLAWNAYQEQINQRVRSA